MPPPSASDLRDPDAERKDVYYTHSGAVGLTGPLTMLASGALAGALLGALYGQLLAILPLVYANFLLTVLLGTALGRVGSLGARLGHVRNRFYACWLGGLSALVAWYCSWITWLHAVYDDQVWLVRPEQVFQAAADVLAVGAWTLNGVTPTGWGLGLVWLVEAALIIGGAVVFVSRSIQDMPFCESCSCWLEVRRTVSPLGSVPLKRRAELRRMLEQGDFSMLRELELVPRTTKLFSELHVRSCPRCDDLHTLSLAAVLATGKAEEPSVDVLVSDLLIGRDLAEEIDGRWQKLLIQVPEQRASDAPGGGAPESGSVQDSA